MISLRPFPDRFKQVQSRTILYYNIINTKKKKKIYARSYSIRSVVIRPHSVVQPSRRNSSNGLAATASGFNHDFRYFYYLVIIIIISLFSPGIYQVCI